MEEKTRRGRRSKAEIKQERIQKYIDEIARYKEKISILEQRIKEEETPSVSIKDVTSKIKELGVSPEDVLKAVEKLASK